MIRPKRTYKLLQKTAKFYERLYGGGGGGGTNRPATPPHEPALLPAPPYKTSVKFRECACAELYLR